MTSDPDIFRAAKLVMDKQGEEPATFAGGRAEKLRLSYRGVARGDRGTAARPAGGRGGRGSCLRHFSAFGLWRKSHLSRSR